MSCEQCEEKILHIHYYLVSQIPKYNSFSECFDAIKKEMIDYHNLHGKNGFGSERTSASYLDETNILNRAKIRYDIDSTSDVSVQSVACRTLEEVQYIKEDPKFIKFVGEPNVE